MKRVVYKYMLDVTPKVQEIAMPKGAEIIHLDNDYGTGEPAMWASVDPTAPIVPRYFQMFGTGDTNVPDLAVYIGSASQGWYVWHFFERMI